MRKQIITMLALLLLCSCGEKRNPNETRFNERYALVIPAYLPQSSDSGIPDLYTYDNEELDMILRVNSQEKTALKAMSERQDTPEDMSTLIGYSSYWINHYLNDFSQVDNIDREMLVVNGVPTVIVYVLGALDGKITTLAMAFYEGTDVLYQVISYYPYNNQMELRKTIGEMFQTFREIN